MWGGSFDLQATQPNFLKALSHPFGTNSEQIWNLICQKAWLSPNYPLSACLEDLFRALGAPKHMKQAAVSELFGTSPELIWNNIVYTMGIVTRLLKSFIYVEMCLYAFLCFYLGSRSLICVFYSFLAPTCGRRPSAVSTKDEIHLRRPPSLRIPPSCW